MKSLFVYYWTQHDRIYVLAFLFVFSLIGIVYSFKEPLALISLIPIIALLIISRYYNKAWDFTRVYWNHERQNEKLQLKKNNDYATGKILQHLDYSKGVDRDALRHHFSIVDHPAIQELTVNQLRNMYASCLIESTQRGETINAYFNKGQRMRRNIQELITLSESLLDTMERFKEGHNPEYVQGCRRTFDQVKFNLQNEDTKKA